MGYKKKTFILSIIAILLILLYIFYQLTGNIGYILPRRIIKVVAIILTGGSIAFATTIFMTITNNRILTPSIMGLDYLYMLIQVFIIFSFGSKSLVMLCSHINFFVTIGIRCLCYILFFCLFIIRVC